MGQRPGSTNGIPAIVPVPDASRARWRALLDVAAEVVGTFAARVTRVHPGELEVFATSEGSEGQYTVGERAPLEQGLFCEAVIRSRAALLVRDARVMPYWSRNNPDLERGMVSYLGFPVLWPERQVFGTISVLDTCGRDYSGLHRRVLKQFRYSVENDLALLYLNQRFAGAVVHGQRAKSSLQKARSEMAAVSRLIQLISEHERYELGRDLHDEIVQGLTAVKMDLTACASRLPGDTFATVAPVLASTIETIDLLVLRARRISDSLAPPVLEDLGLASAIEWEADECTRRAGVLCSVDRMDDLARLQPQEGIIFYRAFQRALDYMVSSAPATGLHIEVKRTKARVVLTMAATGDAGQPQPAEHVGLAALGQQVRGWGGRLRTWSTPDGERMLQVSMPFNTTGP